MHLCNKRLQYILCVHCLESSTQQSSGHVCRAFALEGRGIWHALSASVTQQIIGPVRARADFRYALDLPSNIPQASLQSFIHSLKDRLACSVVGSYVYSCSSSIRIGLSG